MQLNGDMWVIFKLAQQHFGLSTGMVREMVALPEVRTVPSAPACVRGVTNLRGKVHTVWDLRQLLGLSTLRQEGESLIQALDQQEADHLNWLAELEASVRDARPFARSTDPHQCPFGIWYDHFTTDNLILSALLKKFDDPHKRIHALGARVAEAVQAGRKDEGLALIATSRQGDLHSLSTLFEQTRKHLRLQQNEIGIVLNLERHAVILTADAILSVENPEQKSPDDLEQLRSSLESNLDFIEAIGHLKNDPNIIMLLDPEQLKLGTERTLALSA